jgi:hypothetical protein
MPPAKRLSWREQKSKSAVALRKRLFILPPPEGLMNVKKSSATWKIYRTRFLIKARQLTQPLLFVDALGREHCGQPGDYLVESSDGARRIAPRLIFEDVYVAMGLADPGWPPRLDSGVAIPAPKRRISTRPAATA